MKGHIGLVYRHDCRAPLIVTHHSGDHVGSLYSNGFDSLKYVNFSFNFDSLNLRHSSNEDTSTTHTITAIKKNNKCIDCYTCTVCSLYLLAQNKRWFSHPILDVLHFPHHTKQRRHLWLPISPPFSDMKQSQVQDLSLRLYNGRSIQGNVCSDRE